MATDMNPRTQGMVHPEQRSVEFFLGYFDPTFATRKMNWKTKRIGTITVREDGTPYPSTIRDMYRPVPVFVLRAEILMHHYRVIWGAGRSRARA